SPSSAVIATSRRSSRSPGSTACSRFIPRVTRPCRSYVRRPISRPRRPRSLRRALSLAAASLLLAGCGAGGLVSGGDKEAGKKLFSEKCGGCHTLADAGTTGTTGPNLDQLKPPFAIVQRQVINGGAIMPAFKSVLSAAQIRAVATYVSSHTGK